MDELAEMEQVEQLGEQVMLVVPRQRPARPARGDDFSPPLATRLLVLQPTPFCNIDCAYCYLPHRDDRSRMSLDTARLAARRLVQDGLLDAELTVVWHAGEPLVLPPDWYEAAFAAIAAELPPGVRLTHAIQTNATLIDDAWCDFFLRHRVQLGVSVDGPADMHDARRRTRAGRGTHAQVLRAIERLQRHGVPFHAIAVVGAATLARADDFYDWFEQHGIVELGCNFDEAEGAHARSSLQGEEPAHRAFVQRLLERAAGGRVLIREFAAAWRALREPLPVWHWHGHAWPQNTQVMPLALVTVAHDGRFGTFSPELLGQPWPAWGDFVLGDVRRGGYVAALSTPAFARLWRDIARGIAACEAGCAHFAYCGGGAPANKLYETGSAAAAETLHCRSMVKRPFDALLRRAEAELGQPA